MTDLEARKARVQTEKEGVPPLPPLLEREEGDRTSQIVGEGLYHSVTHHQRSTQSGRGEGSKLLTLSLQEGHTLKQRFVFRKIFEKKFQDGEIILQDEDACNVHERPFPNYNNKGKEHAMMVLTPASTTETEGEPDIDQMAGRVQHLHKFKHFYDQIDLTPSKGWPSKSIIELTNPGESCDLVEGRSRHRGRFDDNAVGFYDDRRGLPTTHNRPLYVTASVNGVKLKRAMLDPGSSINIISLSTLEAVGFIGKRSSDS